MVAPAVRAFDPGLLLIAAGQDASATDPLGRMSITVPGFRALADRAVALAGEVCDGRLVAMLEGGYSLLHLPLANLAILEGLAGLPADVRRRPDRRRRRRARCATSSVDAVTAAERAHFVLMLHDAHGFWIAEAGSPAVLPALEGEERADVVVIGGGYTGMWTAWHLLEADPDARVVVLEAGRCGHGPSGRNGGFVSSMDLSLPSLRADYGDAAARAWVDARTRHGRRDRRVVRGRGRRRLVPARRASCASRPRPRRTA